MLLLLCLLLQPPGLTDSVSVARSVEAVADSLLNHGFASEAAAEYRRALYEASCDSATTDTAEVALKLGLSLGIAGEIGRAATVLRGIAETRPDLAVTAQLPLAGFYAERGYYDMAQVELSDLLVFSRESAERQRLNGFIAWTQLKRGDLRSAADSYRRSGAADIAGRIESLGPARLRSPGGAMLMSTLLPGLGETYAGRPLSGLLGLCVTAASIAGTVWAARSDDWVSASVLASTFFWRFYNGSRQNAAEFAERHNRAALAARARLVTAPAPDWFGESEARLGVNVEPGMAARQDSTPGLEER